MQLLGVWPKLPLLWYSCEPRWGLRLCHWQYLSLACTKRERGPEHLLALLLSSHRTATAVCNCHQQKRRLETFPGVWVELWGLVFRWWKVLAALASSVSVRQRGHRGGEADPLFRPIPAAQPPSSPASELLLTLPHLLLSTPPHGPAPLLLEGTMLFCL